MKRIEETDRIAEEDQEDQEDQEEIEQVEEAEEVDSDEPQAEDEPQKPVKRKRGRPRIHQLVSTPPPKKRKVINEPPPNLDGEDQESDKDDDGETKINADGNLLGDREFSVRATVLPRHPTRLYMLSMDVAKALGYRDSFAFFARNHSLYKISASDTDKYWLAEHEWCQQQMRVRTITLLTARSVFRRFGHKVVKKGSRLFDDYFPYDQPEDERPRQEQREETPVNYLLKPLEYDLKQQPTTLTPLGMLKSKYTVQPKWTVEGHSEVIVNDVLVKSAASAAEFNSRLRAMRQGMYYDFNTNLDLVPKLRQPVACRVEIQSIFDY